MLLRQLKRFRHLIHADKVFGTHTQPQDTAGRNWLVSGVKGVTSTRYFPSVERHLVVGRWMRCIQRLKILRSERQ
jgi:hypothetical protein